MTAPDAEALVRQFDYDRYVSALFATAGQRAHLFALYACNFEIARLGESVRNPMAGQLRLQWWRDAIDELYAGARGRTDVLAALAHAIRALELPKEMFEAALDARELDFENAPFGDIGALEKYAEDTSGGLMRLAARIVGAGDSIDDIARDAGIAYAVVGLLRAAPFHAARGRIVLPVNELEATGIGPAEFLRGRGGDAASRVVVKVAAVAEQHYSSVRAIERKFLPAILPAAIVPAVLRRVTRRGFDLFRDTTELAGWRRQAIMLAAMVRGRI